jgi:hypothetical protein
MAAMSNVIADFSAGNDVANERIITMASGDGEAGTGGSNAKAFGGGIMLMLVCFEDDTASKRSNQATVGDKMKETMRIKRISMTIRE